MLLKDSPALVSVSALVALLKELVEDNFVDVLVRGELSNLSRPASGHCYFTLKDSRAQLRCAMFRSHARMLRFAPDNGMQVICRGRLSLYPQRGDLQLIVETIEPEGVGQLQLAFEQLKSKLAAEGLFAEQNKKPIPAFPRTVGVITSASGAALRDILNILRRRAAGLQVLLRPVTVQGEGAASDIAAAIAELNREGSCDVLIVGRGGGSLEDLWAFNEELLARAIHASQIPVISAVGHETDYSIADMVADLRAPTPSAAAELVARHRLELERHLDQLSSRLAQQMRSRLVLLGQQLESLEKRLRGPLEQIAYQRLRLEQAQSALQQALQRQLENSRLQFERLAGRLDDLSPLRVLARGYAIASRLPEGSVITDAAAVSPGELLQLQLEHGELDARVEAVRPLSAPLAGGQKKSE